jgi:hypothetical protein
METGDNQLITSGVALALPLLGRSRKARQEQLEPAPGPIPGAEADENTESHDQGGQRSFATRGGSS